jgi:hypothetical protein
MGRVFLTIFNKKREINKNSLLGKNTNNIDWTKLSLVKTNTGCLMKNASTHNFVIYYLISMNKKIKDMVFQALQNSHKMFFFLRYLQ